MHKIRKKFGLILVDLIVFAALLSSIGVCLYIYYQPEEWLSQNEGEFTQEQVSKKVLGNGEGVTKKYEELGSQDDDMKNCENRSIVISKSITLQDGNWKEKTSDEKQICRD